MNQARRALIFCAALGLITFVVFAPVTDHEFVNYDDPDYVTDNPHVKDGLSSQSLRWAFLTTHGDNTLWHPLTWVSHLLDVQLYGIKSGPHHAINLLLHVVNVMLVFLVLHRFTGASWRPAIVAALFALHPLQVDTVAWVSERKNVLSGFFWLLTMLAYGYYATSPRVSRYLLVVLCFAAGLLSKPTVVTLPFVLLLLDLWPLRRFEGITLAPDSADEQKKFPSPKGVDPKRGNDYPTFSQLSLTRLLLEKVPLLAMSAGCCVITLIAQEAVLPGNIFALSGSARVGNALVSYVRYLRKTFWPTDLAVFYPHPGQWPVTTVAGSALLLILLTAVAIWKCWRSPYVLVGWLWFVGVMVPTIGIVQTGAQAMADRYAYLPLIGIFIALVWGAAELIMNWTRSGLAYGCVALSCLVFCVGFTSRQIGFWRNSTTLFQRDLVVAPDNSVARVGLGVAYEQHGNTAAALQEYRRALEIEPTDPRANYNLATLLTAKGDYREAVALYEEALKASPNSARVHNNLAAALAGQGKYDASIDHFKIVVRLNPNDAPSYLNLAIAQRDGGRIESAAASFLESARLNPNHAESHYQAALLLFKLHRDTEAMEHLRRAAVLDPGSSLINNNFAWLLSTHPDSSVRNGKEAVQVSRRLCDQHHGEPEYLDTLAAAMAEAGEFETAVATAQQALDGARHAANRVLTDEISGRLAFYRERKAYHIAPP